MRITVQISAETHSALQRRAEIMRRPVGWVAREAIEAWLASGERPTEAEVRRWVDDTSGVTSVMRGEIPDTSADELLGGGGLATVTGPMSLGTPKPQRLAAARAALSGAKERRGYGDGLEVDAEDSKSPMSIGRALGRQAMEGVREEVARIRERRGFETREVGPNKLLLEVPIPGESYVDEND